MEDISKVGVIEYLGDGFYFKTIHRGDVDYSHIEPGKHGFVKVIGNIYQHKHLLE